MRLSTANSGLRIGDGGVLHPHPVRNGPQALQDQDTLHLPNFTCLRFPIFLWYHTQNICETVLDTKLSSEADDINMLFAEYFASSGPWGQVQLIPVITIWLFMNRKGIKGRLYNIDMSFMNLAGSYS